MREHNRQVKPGTVQVRIIHGPLPSKNPGLNPIEPHWRHGTRAVVEPARLLSPEDVRDRVGASYVCS